MYIYILYISYVSIYIYIYIYIYTPYLVFLYFWVFYLFCIQCYIISLKLDKNAKNNRRRITDDKAVDITSANANSVQINCYRR